MATKSDDALKALVIESLRKSNGESKSAPEMVAEKVKEKPPMFADEDVTEVTEGKMLLSERLKELGVVGAVPPKDLYITVYKTEIWGDNASFIPKYDVNHVWDWDFLADFILAHENGDNIFVGGPTGTGKTMSSRNYSALVNKPWIRYNGHEESTADDIVGSMAVVQNAEGGVETPFVDGALTVAMKIGADLCVDEPTQIPPSPAMIFQAPLEGMPLVITSGNNSFSDRIIEPHPAFRMVMCDNSTGTGDETGLYAGCKVWNIATLDRFGTALWLDYMPKNKEATMLKKAHPTVTKELTDKLLQFASLIRKAHIRGDLQLTMSARGLLNITNKCLQTRNPARAVRLAFFNKFGNDAEKQAVSSMFFDAFGSNL